MSQSYGRPHPPSSNAWDCVGFGHHDGYSGAPANRALRGATAMARDAGDESLASRTERGAKAIRAAFVPQLFNPNTGWLAAWRCADGKLHDPGAWMVTAMAATFGMLEADQARDMLGRLESRRMVLGVTDFRYGLSAQWSPIPRGDTRMEPSDQPFAVGGDFVPTRDDGADTYGIFTNGSLSLAFVQYYLYALSGYGFNDAADHICDDLLKTLEAGVFDGAQADGCEIYTHDGMKCGYEGTLATIFGVVTAIGGHRGWIGPLKPRWWPA